MAGKKTLERFVVKWKFKKTRPDELNLDEGDVVLVAAKFKDGWCRGIRLRGYQVGFFPEDFVDKGTMEKCDVNGIPTEKWSEIFANDEKNCKTGLISEDDDPKRKEDQRKAKRTKAAEEILSTEISYWSGLNLITEHFIQPMKIYGILSLEEIDIIFSNVESLAGISQELISKLQDRLNRWDVNTTMIGDILTEMFFYLKMFKPYFDSRSAANRIRIQYEKTNDRFKNFLLRVNCGHTLDSLLLMPIQRIPRYELLLKELVKRTDQNHPDYNNLSEALSKAKETAADLNEHIRQIENESKIFEIIKKFPNDELDLIITTGKISPKTKRNIVSPAPVKRTRNLLDVNDGVTRSHRSASLTEIDRPSRNENGQIHHAPSDPALNNVRRKNSNESHTFKTRMFIYEGTVQKVMFKNNNNVNTTDIFGELSERYLILFSDIAILAVEAGNVITGNKLKLKERINLSQCWITEAQSLLKKEVPEEMFVLGTPRKTYIFQAATVKERTTWEKLLWQRISEEKEKFLSFWKGKKIPDEIFIKSSGKAKVEYMSMNENELDLHYNEEISIIGLRKDNVWTPGLYDPDDFSYNFVKDWFPGVNKMGKFGWFPADCIISNYGDSKEKSVNEPYQPLSVATALQIKQKMLELTQSELEIPRINSVKVFRADGTFRTFKLDENTTTDDIISHLDKHNRNTGLIIEKECIELWQESKDGTVKKKNKLEEKILDIISFWGQYQNEVSFNTRTRGMKESVETIIDTCIEKTMVRRQSRGASPGIRRATDAQETRTEQNIIKASSFSGHV